MQDVTARPGRLRAGLMQIAGGALIGLLATVFTISFATIVYAPSLPGELGRGITVTLMAASVMAAAGALLFSFRGTVTHPQDVTAILLAGGATAIAAETGGGDAGFATVLAFIAVSSVAAGVVAALMGHLRMSYLARFLPYPVLGGFLCATGYLLTIGGLGLAAGRPLTLWTIADLWREASVLQWLPWLAAAALMVAVTRRVAGDLVLPLSILLALTVFYASLALFGLTIADAGAMGFLLGPFPQTGSLAVTGSGFFALIDWGAIAEQTLVVIAVIAMTLVGGVLNITGVGHVVGHESDLDRDLRAMGYSNILSGSGGGLVGYPTFGESILGWRLGMRGVSAGLAAALFPLAAALIGTEALGVLPVGFFGMLLAFLGLDLMFTWLWVERRRLPTRDFAIVAAILIIAASIGFLEALAFGLLASMLLFIVTYAQLDPVRSQTSLATRRSMVERSTPANERLNDAGDAICVFELSGYLFFGTATRLRDQIAEVLVEPLRPPRAVILDFRRVPDADASAIVSIARTAENCQTSGAMLALSGLTPIMAFRIRRFLGSDPNVLEFETLDEALQHFEETLLDRIPPDVTEGGFLEGLERAFPDYDVPALFQRRAAPTGEVLIAQAEDTAEIMILASGAARAVLHHGTENELVVARFLPGAVIGEMAFYGGVARSASVIADEPVELLEIDPTALEKRDDLPPGFVATFHRGAAHHMSRRLDRVTRLLRQSQ